MSIEQYIYMYMYMCCTHMLGLPPTRVVSPGAAWAMA